MSGEDSLIFSFPSLLKVTGAYARVKNMQNTRGESIEAIIPDAILNMKVDLGDKWVFQRELDS